MKVLSIDRIPGSGSTLALACVQITPDIRVNGLRLVRGRAGDIRIYSPNAGGAAVLSFSPAVIAELKAIVVEALESENARDQRAA